MRRQRERNIATTRSAAPRIQISATTWTAWDGTSEITYDADTNTAYVYLTGDVTRDDCFEVGEGHTLYLCLNGHSIKSSYAGEAISVTDSAKFILCNCQSGGAITHSDGVLGKGVEVGVHSSDIATFIMYGGTISGNHVGTSDSKEDGAGVAIGVSGRFTMYGGTISDNHADVASYYGGGGILCNGRFIMYGGTISGNTVTGEAGGGVVAWGSSASAAIYGGIISGNTATGNGGGICTNSPLIISGNSVIENNKAANGGGVYYYGYYSDESLTISDSVKITGNTATGNGGGIAVSNGGALTINGGSITGNSAEGNGGGVCFDSKHTNAFTIAGSAEINGNKKGSADNNVYLPTGKYITITGKLTGSKKIGVTTEAAPDDSNYVKIAYSSNKNYADPEKFQYENDGTLSVSAVGTISVDLVICKHSLSSDWSVDASNHWHNCSICNAKIGVTAHNCDQKVAVEAHKRADATCTSGALYYMSCVCGMNDTETFESGDTNPDNHSSTLGDWQSDGSSHWKEYFCCGIHAETAAHTGGTATCQNKAVCSICNAAYGELGSHNWADTWSKDASSHWHVCLTANCTAENDFAAHTPGPAATEESPQTCTECGYELAPALAHTHAWGSWISNGDGTHTRTCLKDSSHTETNNCYGGTATCDSMAVCSICSRPYGESNANNHAGGTEVRGRVEATTDAEGYTGDTYCKGCDTKIADGTTIPKPDGSSGGRNSSDTGNKSPATSVTVPVSGDEKTIKVDASVRNTEATIENVDLSRLDTVIGNNVKTGVVTIDFSALNTEVNTVKLPADVVKQIAVAVNDPNNDAKSLEIVLSDGTAIEFDAKALGKQVTQADGADITISIKHTTSSELNHKQQQAVDNRPALDINVTSGGKRISDMSGEITLYAPYELRSGEQSNGIVVYYVDENGNRERCETSYDPAKKRVNWKTDHLSVYMIGYDESKVNPDTFYVTYIVQKRDTLWAISRKYGCTVSEIVAANSGLIKNPNLIYPRWQLKIPQD